VPPESTEPVQRGLSPYLFLCLLAVINLAGPFLPVPSLAFAIISSSILTVVYVGAVVGFGLSIARKRFAVTAALALLGVAVLVWLGVEYGLWPLVRGSLRAARAARQAPTSGQQLLFFATTTVQDLAMITGASLVGTMLARLIRHPNMLGPIGAAIALIDIWGVMFGGIVSQMLSNKATQPLAERAMAAGPKVGAIGAARPEFSVEIPSIGVGDFLFIALLLSVLVNLAMNWKTSARLMWLFISFALLSINLLPFVPHLPGLLFIAGAVILPNWKYSRFTREEQFALLYAGILVVVLTVGLYFGFKTMLPPNPEPNRKLNPNQTLRQGPASPPREPASNST
jgi:hypothetical protein